MSPSKFHVSAKYSEKIRIYTLIWPCSPTNVSADWF